MANDFAVLLPLLIADEASRYLDRKPGFLGKILVETGQISQMVEGGNAVVIPTPPTVIAPNNRTIGTDDVGDTEDLVLGSVTLSLDTHKSTRINFSQLESRIAKGNAERFVKMAIKPILDGIIRAVDTAIAAQYVNASFQVGTYNGAITDAILREGLELLAAADVPMDDGLLHLATTSKGYFRDLLGIDRYVTPLNIGEGEDVIQRGKIPTLFGVTVDFSNNVPTSTISSQTSGHSLLFHRDAIVMAFMEFEPASKYGEANVEELFIEHPTGVRIKVSKWFAPGAGVWYMRFEVKYGVKTLNGDLMCEVLHTNAAA
jgi:hypothetical protein